MVFRVESQENPFAALLGGGIAGFANKKFEQQEELARQSKLTNALAKLQVDENTSPLDAMTQILQLPIDINEKKMMLEHVGRQQKQKRDFIAENKRSDAVRNRWGDEWADLYDEATTGGKSDIMNRLLDMELYQENFGENVPPEISAGAEDIAEPTIKGTAGIGVQPKEEPFKWPTLKRQGAGTSAAASRLFSQREKANDASYKEESDKLKGLELDEIGLDQLNTLNETRALPEGLERWNTDGDGNLLLPAAANPESQLYVKTVNGFLKRAKDYFPGRVTNFDLAAFIKGLPTLANDYEGRKVIIKQMQLANQLMALDAKGFMDAVDHYGGGNVSQSEALKLAAASVKSKKKELNKRLKTLDGEFDRLASQRKATKPSAYHIRMTSPKYGTFDMTPEQYKQALEDKEAGWQTVSQRT